MEANLFLFVSKYYFFFLKLRFNLIILRFYPQTVVVFNTEQFFLFFLKQKEKQEVFMSEIQRGIK